MEGEKKKQIKKQKGAALAVHVFPQNCQNEPIRQRARPGPQKELKSSSHPRR